MIGSIEPHAMAILGSARAFVPDSGATVWHPAGRARSHLPAADLDHSTWVCGKKRRQAGALPTLREAQGAGITRPQPPRPSRRRGSENPAVILLDLKMPKVDSYHLGVNAYVVKPVDFTAFVESVSRWGIFWALINEPPPGCAQQRAGPPNSP
jgi:hypothetical protein